MRLAEDASPVMMSNAAPSVSRDVSGPLCARCNTPIGGEWLAVNGKTYHPIHLLCDNCGVVIGVLDQSSPSP